MYSSERPSAWYSAHSKTDCLSSDSHEHLSGWGEAPTKVGIVIARLFLEEHHSCSCACCWAYPAFDSKGIWCSTPISWTLGKQILISSIPGWIKIKALFINIHRSEIEILVYIKCKWISWRIWMSLWSRVRLKIKLVSLIILNILLETSIWSCSWNFTYCTQIFTICWYSCLRLSLSESSTEKAELVSNPNEWIIDCITDRHSSSSTKEIVVACYKAIVPIKWTLGVHAWVCLYEAFNVHAIRPILRKS